MSRFHFEVWSGLRRPAGREVAAEGKRPLVHSVQDVNRWATGGWPDAREWAEHSAQLWNGHFPKTFVRTRQEATEAGVRPVGGVRLLAGLVFMGGFYWNQGRLISRSDTPQKIRRQNALARSREGRIEGQTADLGGIQEPGAPGRQAKGNDRQVEKMSQTLALILDRRRPGGEQAQDDHPIPGGVGSW